MKNGKILLLAPFLALTGCSTLQGLKQDLSSGYHAVSDTVSKWVDPEKQAKMNLPVYDGTCPPVSVRPDLQKLTEFQDDTKTTDALKISEVEIMHVQNTCRVENDALVMQIDISIAGKTGPKARVKPSDQPSFAYPYFVAVTDQTGAVLSKEIFAVTVAYGKDKNELTQTENIFQNMPFPKEGQVYNVVIGFQLTDAQLAYNKANPSTKTVTTSGGAPVPVATTPEPAPVNAIKTEDMPPQPAATHPGATTPSGAPISLIPSTKTTTNQ